MDVQEEKTRMIKAEVRQLVDLLIDNLEKKQEIVIRNRYCIGVDRQKTYQQLAEALGVTPSKVRHIEFMGLQWLLKTMLKAVRP